MIRQVRRVASMRFLAITGVVFAGLSQANLSQAADTHWQRVMAGDRKVGYVEHARHVEGGKVTESERLTLELGRTGRRVTYRVSVTSESNADGSFLRLVRDSQTSEGHAHVDAAIEGADLVVHIGHGRNRSTHHLAGAAANLKAHEFARDWLRAAGSGRSPAPLRFNTYDPVKLAVVEAEYALASSNAGVVIRRSLRTENTETASLQTLNAEGEVIEEQMRLGALQLRLVASSQEQALARGEVLDHVAEQLQKAPYRIPGNQLQAKIRYGFDNRGRTPPLPAGGGQRTWTDGQTTWLQVCASCPVDAAELAGDARARALESTPWMNHDDAVITRRAPRIAGSGTPAQRMRRLTAFVREHMSVTQIDMLGYGTAAEAFRSRRGDCTEYAVLLAAMGRAAGVPTRVAVGMVYSPRFEGHRYVFVPHAWVHAWTGEGWESFDAAQARFDSTHLAFAVSDDGNPSTLFSGMVLAHELRLTSAARVVPKRAATN
jgi:hypothetical protein